MSDQEMNRLLIRIPLAFCALIITDIAAIGALKSTGIPRFDRSVAGAVAYLKSAQKVDERETSLIAYALLKAGEPADSEMIQHGIRDAVARNQKGYEGYDHIYLAGVDALLLSEIDPDLYLPALQKIADHVASRQHASGGWSESTSNADTSMAQYAMLALWAAQSAGARIAPEVVERNVNWHLKFGTPDGSWGYRPEGVNTKSSHNLSMAGAASLGIGRLLLYGRKTKPKEEAPEKKFGVLEKVKEEPKTQNGFANYQPRVAAGAIDSRIVRAFNWIAPRFPPPQDHPPSIFPQYFFYALERAAALHELGPVNGRDWYETYGDVLLGMQNASGVFDRGMKQHQTGTIGTSFAILYFMKSTQQKLDKQFGKGRMTGSRDLTTLYGKKKEKKELGPLDELLGAMMTNVADLEKLDDAAADAVIEKVQFSSRDELVGQVDMLKKLLESRSAENRRTAYWALGRTGDFNLIPLMMQGLRDPNVDCNVEALRSLRYIARKPNGFGLSLNPLEGAETANNDRKVEVANQWRTKAYKTWGDWYRKVRPFDEGGGLDELELSSKGGN